MPSTFSSPPRHRSPHLDSATPAALAWTGLLAYLAASAFALAAAPFVQAIHAALFIIAVTAAALFAIDTIFFKVHRRSSTGLDWSRWNPSIRRTLTKYLGFLATLTGIGGLYWLFPEYHNDYYDRYFAILKLILAPWLLLALPYFYWIDARMREPHDAYWHLGKLLALDWRGVDVSGIRNHCLGWLVKGFFLPLMLTFFCNDITALQNLEPSRLTTFGAWFRLLFDGLLFIDVGLASLGYIMSLRLFDTHLRWTEPSLLGWAAALACYPPFWTLIGRQYLAYQTGFDWETWLQDSDWLRWTWGSLILALTGIYVWATVMFGARFSNLTHRGIITNGPYRWTKHPAYLAKNLSWWLIAIPFVAVNSWDEAVRHCLLLGLLNAIYWLRAVTEERHLMRDPAYAAYADSLKRRR